jgi:hypothetical protein
MTSGCPAADLVCYWFDKARAQIEQGKVMRVGLVATNRASGEGRTARCWNAFCRVQSNTIKENAMATITFDTLEPTDSLKKAGVPAEQAEAVVRAIARAQDTW